MGGILPLSVLPFLGILIYTIARPKMTAQGRQIIGAAEKRQRRPEGESAADEVARLAKLRDTGEITAQDYERLKARAVVWAPGGAPRDAPPASARPGIRCSGAACYRPNGDIKSS